MSPSDRKTNLVAAVSENEKTHRKGLQNYCFDYSLLRNFRDLRSSSESFAVIRCCWFPKTEVVIDSELRPHLNQQINIKTKELFSHLDNKYHSSGSQSRNPLANGLLAIFN